MSDNKLTSKKISIFTQAVDNYYSKDSNNQSIDNNYSYDGCDVLEIDKILDKSDFSKIEEEMNDYSTHGVFSDEDSNKNSGLSDGKIPNTSIINKKQRKLTDFFHQPWVDSISSLKKQVSNRIDKNNFLDGTDKVSSRKLTFDTTPSTKFKTNTGFN